VHARMSLFEVSFLRAGITLINIRLLLTQPRYVNTCVRNNSWNYISHWEKELSIKRKIKKKSVTHSLCVYYCRWTGMEKQIQFHRSFGHFTLYKRINKK
jgi:hypothetical protein